MIKYLFTTFLCVLITMGTAALPARAASASELDYNAIVALEKLFAKNHKAAQIANQSDAILVFPTVVKAGFMVGAHRGDGVLIRNGQSIGYYNTSQVSYGFQAGVQTYGYALFFMNPSAVAYLRKSKGWEIGTGPSIVVVDKGMAGGA